MNRFDLSKGQTIYIRSYMNPENGFIPDVIKSIGRLNFTTEGHLSFNKETMVQKANFFYPVRKAYLSEQAYYDEIAHDILVKDLRIILKDLDVSTLELCTLRDIYQACKSDKNIKL